MSAAARIATAESGVAVLDGHLLARNVVFPRGRDQPLDLLLAAGERELTMMRERVVKLVKKLNDRCKLIMGVQATPSPRGERVRERQAVSLASLTCSCNADAQGSLQAVEQPIGKIRIPDASATVRGGSQWRPCFAERCSANAQLASSP